MYKKTPQTNTPYTALVMDGRHSWQTPRRPLFTSTQIGKRCLRQKNATPFSPRLYFNLEVKPGYHRGWCCSLVSKGQAQFWVFSLGAPWSNTDTRPEWHFWQPAQKVNAQEKCTPHGSLAWWFRDFRKAENRKTTEIHPLFKDTTWQSKICQISTTWDISKQNWTLCADKRLFFPYIFTWN